MSVLVVTSVGDIVVDLYTDRCPLTTKNFLKLCKMKYYNGCLFHKVEKNFLAQTGDRTGTGDGGESLYKFLYGDQARFFDDEIHPDLKHHKIGTVAMASAGKNCNASQFYFTLRDELDYLDGKHTVFGAVEEQEGLETLAKINESFVDDKGRPLKNIRIKHTYILDDPFSDPAQMSEFIPENSPEDKPDEEVAEERLEDNWVPLEDTVGAAELVETLRAKEAHTNAAILESIGDIPDADIKPPENVLFVCKLNPVTQDEDLHTIFSRFGTVVSADVIRDFKTGDSLCYAFIEFEAKESCELAYIKMDNTLIDDRRIHVDFSQSVSKLWIQYRHGKRSQNKGEGCFKCGSVYHIAKNCDKESGSKMETSKYILKEANAQRGGGRQSYEMVFDDDVGGTDINDDKSKIKQKKLKVDDRNYEDSKKRGYSREGVDTRSCNYEHRNDYSSRDYKHTVEREIKTGLREEHQRNSNRTSRGGKNPDRCEDAQYRRTDAVTQKGEREQSERSRNLRDDEDYREKRSDQYSHRKDKSMKDTTVKKERTDHQHLPPRSNEVIEKRNYHLERRKEEVDRRRDRETFDRHDSRIDRDDTKRVRKDERKDRRDHHERMSREEKRR